MSRFWPEGLSLDDTQSPYEILESAMKEWEESGKGILALMLQKNEPQGREMIITVHAKHIPSDRTATLFSVIHRLDIPYPVAIDPVEDRLPISLKKSYYQRGISEEQVMVSGRTITNEWVSDTPSEFRKKLGDAFNLSSVKAVVLSLTSGVQK